VLRRDIPWGTYMSARLLSDKDLQLIRKFDNKSEATQSQLLAEVWLSSAFQGLLHTM
jgi:V-type H+-transporting ATPase subunit H